MQLPPPFAFRVAIGPEKGALQCPGEKSVPTQESADEIFWLANYKRAHDNRRHFARTEVTRARRQAARQLLLAHAFPADAVSVSLAVLAFIGARFIASVKPSLNGDVCALVRTEESRIARLRRPNHLTIVLAASASAHLVLHLRDRAKSCTGVSADTLCVRPAACR